MQRAILTVKGRVQKVGYRDFVAQIANKMDISGTVQNLPDGKTVKIIAEAEKNVLEKFINLLWAKDDNIIKVIKIDVKYEPSEGEYEFFDIIYDDIQKENFERIGEAVGFLKSLDSGQKVMIEKQDQMLEKQDIMIDKQDQTTGKIDQNRVEIKSEIHGLRNDFKSHFDERLSKMEFELAEI
ncbi:MAG TPA: acylphosphatase [Candidatus Methanoperedens sp.]